MAEYDGFADGYRWSRPTLEDALRGAGFDRIRWIMPELSPEAARGPDPQHWQDFLDQPLCVIIECVKDGADEQRL